MRIIPIAYSTLMAVATVGGINVGTGEIGLAIRTLPDGRYIIFSDPVFHGIGSPRLEHAKVIYTNNINLNAINKRHSGTNYPLRWLDRDLLFVGRVNPLISYDPTSGTISSRNPPISSYSVFRIKQTEIVFEPIDLNSYAEEKYGVPKDASFLGVTSTLIFHQKKIFDGYLYYKNIGDEWIRYRLPKHVLGIESIYATAGEVSVVAYGKNPNFFHLHPGWVGVIKIPTSSLEKSPDKIVPS